MQRNLLPLQAGCWAWIRQVARQHHYYSQHSMLCPTAPPRRRRCRQFRNLPCSMPGKHSKRACAAVIPVSWRPARAKCPEQPQRLRSCMRSNVYRPNPPWFAIVSSWCRVLQSTPPPRAPASRSVDSRLLCCSALGSRIVPWRMMGSTLILSSSCRRIRRRCVQSARVLVHCARPAPGAAAHAAVHARSYWGPGAAGRWWRGRRTATQLAHVCMPCNPPESRGGSCRLPCAVSWQQPHQPQQGARSSAALQVACRPCLSIACTPAPAEAARAPDPTRPAR
jgi:hypothetical protein